MGTTENHLKINPDNSLKVNYALQALFKIYCTIKRF